MKFLEKLQRAIPALRRLTAIHSITAVLFAAVIASGPRFLRGVSCGHDFNFHLLSWMEVQKNWSEGVLYPHWAQTPNWGAGEARFIFYPPVTWIIGGALGYLTNWAFVPALLTFLCLAFTGIATRTLARQFVSTRAATLAGMLATGTPYALFTSYERTAFSELAAASLIPLLLLYALGRKPASHSFLRDEILNGSTGPLSLLVAVIWLTNAPAGVMASYLFAFAALAAALLQRSWGPILRAGIAVIVGLALAALYLVPAAYEQKWIAIKQALDVGMRVSDSWLFAHHNSPDLVLHDQVLHTASIIVAITISLAALGFVVAYLRGKLPRSNRHLWIPLALLIPAVFLLQFPVSTLFWDLPRLQFLQFPWRWLAVLNAPFAIFVAAMLPNATRRGRIFSLLIVTVFLLAASASATRFFFQVCDDEDNVPNQIDVFHDQTGVEGTDEYAAAGSDNSLVASGLPQGCLVADATQELGVGDKDTDPVWYTEQGSCDETYTADLWQIEHKQLEIDSDHEGFVVLRLRRYPAWKITVNGKVPDLTSVPLRDDGLLVIPISAGPSSIDVRWTNTPDVLWGRWISLGGLLILLALWMAESRNTLRRLS